MSANHMLNFNYENPTRIVFGKGQIAELPNLIPKDKKVLVYAMTASNNPIDDVKLASRTFVRPDER